MNFLADWRAKIIITAYRNWLKPNSKVLDIGCGDMVITKKLKEYFDLDIMGTDILDWGKENIPFKKCGGTLPFKNKEFDFALIISTLHHCENPRQVVQEALRVAKAVLIFETEPTFSYAIYDFLANILKFKVSKGNFKTLREWLKIFKDFIYDFRIQKSIFTHYIFKIN